MFSVRSHVSIFCVALALLALDCCCEETSQCSNLQAIGGDSYRWPVVNPGLVAPVFGVFDYPTLDSPLTAEHTGRSLQINLPDDFAGGFSLMHNSSQGGTTDEVYHLKRVLIRLPALVPEGEAQVLSHSLEVCLLHQEEGSSQWANVIIPFHVQAGDKSDPLTSLVGGAQLPNQEGHTAAVLTSSAQKLDLNQAWADASFSHFWSTLPTECGQTTVSARHLLRTDVMMTSPDTFAALIEALVDARTFTPTEIGTAWLLHSCRSGETCPLQPGANLTERVSSATLLQSQKVASIRSSKAALDTALQTLQNASNNGSNVAEAYNTVVAARDQLLTAEAQLTSAKEQVIQLNTWTSELGATWDASKPVTTNTSTNATGSVSTSLFEADDNEDAATTPKTPAATKASTDQILLQRAMKPLLKSSGHRAPVRRLRI